MAKLYQTFSFRDRQKTDWWTKRSLQCMYRFFFEMVTQESLWNDQCTENTGSDECYYGTHSLMRSNVPKYIRIHNLEFLASQFTFFICFLAKNIYSVLYMYFVTICLQKTNRIVHSFWNRKHIFFVNCVKYVF